MIRDMIIEILDRLDFPYDDYCMNYIVKEMQNNYKNEITEDNVKAEWLWYVKENLFV